jgi:hypothetical protein
VIKCNFGKKVFPGYTEPTHVKLTKRGRKKKEKKKKDRKKQGDGSDFNSQVTLTVLSHDTTVTDMMIPAGSKVYKFKVFRNGKIQLPGVHRHLLMDIISCANDIAGLLNQHLHFGESDITRLSYVISISPVMKNYKFIIKVPEYYVLDLRKLNWFFRTACKYPDDLGEPAHPSIFMIKYNRQDNELSLKFNTPLPYKPLKKTRVKIFMRGKVNILGAFDADVTYQICNYLHWFCALYWDSITIPDNSEWWYTPTTYHTVPSPPHEIMRLIKERSNSIYVRTGNSYTILRPTCDLLQYALSLIPVQSILNECEAYLTELLAGI